MTAAYLDHGARAAHEGEAFLCTRRAWPWATRIIIIVTCRPRSAFQLDHARWEQGHRQADAGAARAGSPVLQLSATSERSVDHKYQHSFMARTERKQQQWVACRQTPVQRAGTAAGRPPPPWPGLRPRATAPPSPGKCWSTLNAPPFPRPMTTSFTGTIRHALPYPLSTTAAVSLHHIP
jgi:hypothetical protein